MENTNFYEEHQEALKISISRITPQLEEISKTHGEETAYLYARKKVDEILDRSGIFEKAACNSGCSHCCHSTIYVSKLEGDYIKKVVTENNITPSKTRIERQRSSGFLAWEDQACPLLLEKDVNGLRKCSIYEDRPIVCRTHNSVENSMFCNKDVFINRPVREGRIIEAEAIGLALVTLHAGEEKDPSNFLIKLHTLL